jgi:hypothetical protein
MLQNREVGGATMGARRGTATQQADRGSATRQVTFGPYGYLNLAVPTAVLALFLSGLAMRLNDPLGLRWTWLTLVLVVASAVLSAFTRTRGAETDLRYRAGPRNLAFWTQTSAPWVILGLFLIAFIGYFAGLPVLVTVIVGVACGATGGLAPTYFQTPPPAPPDLERGSADDGSRAEDVTRS